MLISAKSDWSITQVYQFSNADMQTQPQSKFCVSCRNQQFICSPALESPKKTKTE